jgi:hypothetical protein
MKERAMPRSLTSAHSTLTSAIGAEPDMLSSGTTDCRLRGNRGYNWDDFDPYWYAAHNYGDLRFDDLRILQVVRDFFSAHFESHRSQARPQVCGVDVGSGANLYPALAMLPFCREITLWERGARNVEWLNDEVSWYSSDWDKYWRILARRAMYDRIEKPRDALKLAARVRKGDLFHLPKRRWDVGTMFFVAESISDQEREFKAAIERFVCSLKPASPFAIAFMRDSTGYYVNTLRFPAVAVTEVDVKHALAPLAHDLDIREIRSERKLRDGYNGMILAFGKAGGP